METLISEIDLYKGQFIYTMFLLLIHWFLGMESRRVISEPTAAALAYGLHKKKNVEYIIVVDLGQFLCISVMYGYHCTAEHSGIIFCSFEIHINLFFIHL